jgi:hypothetical protein
MISCGWIISHRCSWITVYVLCCNVQMNVIVIFMTCTCIVMHSLFCQLPNYNLFTQHVISLWRDTSSELWTPVHSFTFILPSTANTVYFPQALFYFTANKHLVPHCMSNPLFQQTSEINNLTVSWGKVFWLCCVQVSHCCRHRHRAINCLLAPASNNLQKLFLSPTGQLNFGFILREYLLLCWS